MLFLAFVSVALVWSNYSGGVKLLLWVIWAIFALDVLTRLYLAREKLGYVIRNPFDLVCVIPLDSTFLLARFARFIRLFRLKTVLTRYTLPIKERLEKVRLPIYLMTILISFALLQLILWVSISGWTFLQTWQWILWNFLAFNYAENLVNVPVLIIAIVIKIIGLITFGILISQAMLLFTNWRTRKKSNKNVNETT